MTRRYGEHFARPAGRQIKNRGAQTVTRGNWWTGPWPEYNADIPAIDSGDIVVAYQPKWSAGSIYARADAANQANSLINLANPGTNDAVAVNAPAWTLALGWDFNFAAVYPAAYDTGVVPLTTWGMLAMINQSSDGFFAALLTGARVAGTDTRFTITVSGGGVSYGYGGFATVAPNTISAATCFGVYNSVGYRDGQAVGSITTGFSGSPTNTLYVGGVNDGALQGGIASFSSFVLFKQATVAQIEALTWAMRAIEAG